MRYGWAAFALFALTPAAAASAADRGPSLPDKDCAMCHDGSDPGIPRVTQEMLAGSSHAGFACVDCHADVDEVPHAEDLAGVSCGGCHADALAAYTRHGQGTVGQTEDLPGCANCHGSHAILPGTQPASSVHPHNLPETCGNCHENLDLAKKHDILLRKPVELFETSVHGKAVLEGNAEAPTCVDCHSAERTSHRVLGAGDAESKVSHFQIPNTCGNCHGKIAEEYWEGIHGQLARRGQTDTPVCTDCHGEHGILPPGDPRSTVSPAQVASATCEPCHEAARLNEAYGRRLGKISSFVDSYHGLKSKAGDPTVANCSSCHGAHKILRSDNPASSIHPDNLKHTCGTCHSGITTQLASTRIHGDGLASLNPRWPAFFRKIYVALIALVIGGMLLYVAVDFRKQTADLRRRSVVRDDRTVERMSRNAVLQHALLTVSFLALVVTGFALRYSEAWLFRMLFGWDGGFGVRGTIHRVAGCALIASALWHLAYLRTTHGRSFLLGMAPSLRDARELSSRMLYDLGLRGDGPRFGRFSYVEKAEYWALVWGTVVMAATGLFLWFDNVAVRWFSTSFLDVMHVVHFYEAWLATLAIAVWHMYSVVFQPGVYPGNPAWITGRMPRTLYEHEHPADPALEEPQAKPRANPES